MSNSLNQRSNEEIFLDAISDTARAQDISTAQQEEIAGGESIGNDPNMTGYEAFHEALKLITNITNVLKEAFPNLGHKL